MRLVGHFPLIASIKQNIELVISFIKLDTDMN